MIQTLINTGTLQSYQYLGLNTVVVMVEPQADLELTYLSVDDETGAAGDEYTGLDQFGRIGEQLWYNTSTDTAVYDVQYIRDDDGNVLFAIDNVNSSMGGYYTYDGLGQVDDYEQGDVVYEGPDYGISGSVVESESLTYDSLGNDLVNSTTTTGTVTITSAFNFDNQITSISSGTLPTYDNNGNMLTDQNDLVYVVNAWNQIVTVKNSGGTTLETYSYDGLGDRSTNTVYSDDVGTQTIFYYSTSGQVLEEQANATGYYTQRYVWSYRYINSVVDRDTDTSGSGLTATGSEYSRVLSIQDADFNTVALVVMSDGSAAVVERYAYLPFGTVTYMTGSYGLESCSAYGWLYLFQGGRLDTITGDTNFGARSEDSSLEVWTSEDPAEFEGGSANLYTFVQNNPIDLTDPSGLDSCDPLGWLANRIVNNAPSSWVDNWAGPTVYPKPSTLASAVPFVGSFRMALHYASSEVTWGNVGGTILYTLLAASDVLLIRSIAVGGFKVVTTSGWRSLWSPGTVTTLGGKGAVRSSPYHTAWGSAEAGWIHGDLLGMVSREGLLEWLVFRQPNPLFRMWVPSFKLSMVEGLPSITCWTANLSALGRGYFNLPQYLGLHIPGLISSNE